MKKYIIILLILSAACGYYFDHGKPVRIKTAAEKQKKEFLLYLSILSYINAPYEWNDCLYISPINPLYAIYYHNEFAMNVKQYQNIIIGDSTMDISRQYPGWLDSAKTQSVAISGNTLCDYMVQTAINTVSPQMILIATNGGNDLLRQFTDSYITALAPKVFDRYRAKFPVAKIIGIAIHPTQVLYANMHKGITNAAIKTYWQSKTSSCWYDPLSLFGVAEGQAANSNNMLDAVHYNQAMSFSIKSAAQSACGVTW